MILKKIAPMKIANLLFPSWTWLSWRNLKAILVILPAAAFLICLMMKRGKNPNWVRKDRWWGEMTWKKSLRSVLCPISAIRGGKRKMSFWENRREGAKTSRINITQTPPMIENSPDQISVSLRKSKRRNKYRGRSDISLKIKEYFFVRIGPDDEQY